MCLLSYFHFFGAFYTDFYGIMLTLVGKNKLFHTTLGPPSINQHATNSWQRQTYIFAIAMLLKRFGEVGRSLSKHIIYNFCKN